MIYAIQGTPGAFKSCYAVEKFLIPALKAGRRVYTNIEGLSPLYIATYFDLDPVKVDELLNILGIEYDDDGIPSENRDRIRRFYEDLPPNALVIIDEAQNYFSAREFKEKFSADLIPWLTKHRHLGNDVVWISQSIDSVDITFRRNTHLTYSLKRMENIGMKNSSFVYIFDRADTDRRHLARKRYSPNPLVFRCYSSYVSEEVVEKRASHNVLLRSPFMWLVVIAIGFFAYTLIFTDPIKSVSSIKGSAIKTNGKTLDSQLSKKENSSSSIQESSIQEEKQGPCIVKTSKVRGNNVFYFADGTTGYDAGNSVPCSK